MELHVAMARIKLPAAEQAAGAAELQVALSFVSAAAPLGGDAALRVAWPPSAVSAQQLLGGPFSDVVVVCGDRRFQAHRAVLAMASPVFLSMLDSEMAEGGAPEVAIKEADLAVLELLLQHAYGAAVDVPLALAPQLYGLADRFQLRTDLAEQLLLWLSTVAVQPAVLCALLPAAQTLCPAACRMNLYRRAATLVKALVKAPTLGGWPVDAVTAVIAAGDAASGFAIAVSWMKAQPRAAKQRHRWPQLLDTVQWGDATDEQLDWIRRSGAAAVPGLHDRVLDELFRRLKKLRR